MDPHLDSSLVLAVVVRHHCARCGFDLAITKVERHMSELVFLRAYRSRFEAEQAQQYLLDQGIEAWVKADDGGGMYPGLSLGRKGVRLMVREDDADRA
jgi:hypothetical protein